jgi:hypothetical protein
VKLYRKFFQAADGKPVVGARSGMLGVRPADPSRPSRQGDVRAPRGSDLVRPGEGGLSVYSDPAAIRIQAPDLILCVIESADLPPELADVGAAGDPHRHIEPAAEMTLDEFQAALGRSRGLWAIV